MSKKPVPVWIDGLFFPSIKDGAKAIGLTSKKDYNLLFYRLYRGKQFGAHEISLTVPVIPIEPCRRAIEVSPLMRRLCTHRLGAYRGGEW